MSSDFDIGSFPPLSSLLFLIDVFRLFYLAVVGLVLTLSAMVAWDLTS